MRRSPMTAVSAFLVVTLLGAASTASRGTADAPTDPRPGVVGLEDRVRALLDEHGDGVVASVWVGGPGGDPWFALDPDASRPAASAIKTAYLAAFFARFADDLDASPAGLDDALRDDHPAMAPYEPAQRSEIRDALRGATVRRIGGLMMGSVPAPNHVYNAAASAVTALLGGPEALSAAIRDLDQAFAPIVARRYMLAPRDVSGDNEASAAALAAVMRRLALGDLPGVDEDTIEAIRGAILAADGHLGLPGRHQFKGGSLNSDPITRVRSGWWEAPGIGPVCYAVMLAQPDPGSRSRADAADRLEATATRLTGLVLRAVGDAGEGP